MSAHTSFDEMFASHRVMAILRGYTPRQTVQLCQRAWSAGIAVVEVPIQSAAALPALRAAVEAADSEGHIVGAGTVTSPERMAAAVECRAAFTVAPGLDVEIATASMDRGLPHLPGVATATDIQAAQKLGLSWLKVFPARELTASWFRSITAPFPDVHLVATGGIDAENALDFLEAGARVVAVGSALASGEQVERLARLDGLAPTPRDVTR